MPQGDLSSAWAYGPAYKPAYMPLSALPMWVVGNKKRADEAARVAGGFGPNSLEAIYSLAGGCLREGQYSLNTLEIAIAIRASIATVPKIMAMTTGLG